ncbi:MAG TPA: ATP-binding cassette domain-containing protein [Puia sp.]|uniref:ATP-binding cassette domain-containing protein n=1 Tax=Puia sp. TaxID=2045100 RepID=UPI002C67057F|nr:ATP-binding cassette domain-containing protein [Puia sp.]HVU98352.1 ATP-binding cassette domain-containing protein [Puia sp.]
MEFLEVALENIEFTLQKNQRLAIAGETGSGKSTLLKIIAGLAAPKKGHIHFENVKVLLPQERLIPGQPGIAYLSQHFELWHNYRVAEILDYTNDLEPADAQNLYHLCHIDHLLGRRTDQLSGGERQRIALARLLVRPPRLLLLDEPFSNLDMIHKRTLKAVLRNVTAKFDITTILVSHDPYDTLTWAEKLIVLKDSRIVQQGPPREVYEMPTNEYVAGLLGDYALANGQFIRPEAQTAFFFSTHP